MRVGGIVSLTVDGRRYKAKGNFEINLGYPKRESVLNHGSTDYKEMPQEAFIKGEVTDDLGLDQSELVQIKDATVVLEAKSGKTYVWSNAWYSDDGTLNTDEGNIQFRFVSPQQAQVFN